ncbi:MAG: ribonuclease P [Thermoplasmata archaeon]|nr:MAG: ribonuclease P [Thermoplasmata archaeon]
MSRRRNAREKRIQKQIAKGRIRWLFQLAEKYALSGRFDLSNRYVELARKISMRYLVPIPRGFKRFFCKHCYRYLLPGVNCRFRIHRGRIIIQCFNCRKYMRIPLKPHTKK